MSTTTNHQQTQGGRPSPGPAGPSSAARYGLRAGWLMMASGWSANQYSALLGAYRSNLGLSESAVTGLFAIYVVGLVPGLLVGGPLADRLGRRPVALTALTVNLLSSVLLMAGSGVHALLLPGRFLTGVGAGALLAAGSAWVKELSSAPFSPDTPPGAAAKRAGLFVSAGFASGGLVASMIAQWAPRPMVTAYLPHVVLAVVAGLAALRVPESRGARPAAHPTGASPSPAAGPVTGAPPAAHRRRFLRAVALLAPWVFAAPAVGFATLPGLVDDGLTGWQTVYAGITTAVVPGAGLLVQPLARRLAARNRLATAVTGLLVTTVGLVVAAPAAALEQPALALLSGALLGAGYGLALTYALTEVAAMAPPERLARLTAYFWTVAYLGMFTPYVLSLLSGTFAMPTLMLAGAVLSAATCLAMVALNRRAA